MKLKSFTHFLMLTVTIAMCSTPSNATYTVTGDVTLTSETPGLSNNANDNGITLMGKGNTPTLTINSGFDINNNTATRTAGQENTLLDKGNGIYVDGSLNLVGDANYINVQNNEGAGLYIKNGATDGQTNRVQVKNVSLRSDENIAGIVVGNAENSTNKGNAELYVTFDSNTKSDLPILRSSSNISHGIHIAKNAYMNVENARFEVFGNGKRRDDSSAWPENYSKIGDANGILVEGSLDITGQNLTSPGDRGTLLLLENNSLSGMEIRNAAEVGQTNQVTITDMDIDLSANDKYGILVGSNPSNEQGTASLDITSTTGNNWFSQNGDHWSNMNMFTAGDELIFAQNGATVNITNMNFSGWSEQTASLGVDQASLTMKGNDNIFATRGKIFSNNKGTLVVDGMNIGGFYQSGNDDSVSVVYTHGYNGIETLGGSTTISGNGQTLAVRDSSSSSGFPDTAAIYVASKDGQRGNFVLKDMKSQLQGIRVVDSDMSIVSTNRDNFLYVTANTSGSLSVEAIDGPAAIKIDNTIVHNEDNHYFANLKGTDGESSNRHTADLSITGSKLNFHNNIVEKSIF